MTYGTEPRRRFLRRSNDGCRRCRSRHKRCDETQPSCHGCLKAGTQCEYGARSQTIPASGLRSLTLLGDEDESAIQTFNRFSYRVVPYLGSMFDLHYWKAIVLPAAHGHRQIFAAALAVGTLNEIPMSASILDVDVGIRKRYKDAIAWYSDSLKASIDICGLQQSTQEVVLILVASVLYISCEMRQLHYKNLIVLANNTFALVYKFRAELMNTKDLAVLAAVSMLIDLSLTTVIDSTAIPKLHRQTAMVVAYKVLSETGNSWFYRLKLELDGILFDINDLMVQGKMTAGSEDRESMLQRLESWKTAVREYIRDPTVDVASRFCMLRIQIGLPMCEVRCELMSPSGDRKDSNRIVHGHIGQMFGAVENLVDMALATKTPLLPHMIEGCCIPVTLTVLWHRREGAFQQRVEKLLRRLALYLPEYRRLIIHAIAYGKTLVATDPHEATEMEMRLFGCKPDKTLRMWQLQRCTYDLASLP